MSPRKVPMVYNNVEKAESLIGDFANHSHYTRQFEDDDVEIILSTYHPKLGQEMEERMIGRLFPGALSREAIAKAYGHIKTINTPVTNRFNVAGKGSALPRICKNGTVSDTTEVPKSVQEITGFSDVIGYLEATPRCPKPRLSGWTKRHCGARKALEPILREIDDLFHKAYPTEHHWQATSWEEHGGVDNFYGNLSDESAFSSCYGNVDVRSAYHRDGSNTSGSLSALFTMGKYEGGGLVLPQFRVCFNLQPGDLLLFRGDDVHGVLPFKGTRLSGVFFSATHYSEMLWDETLLPDADPNEKPDV